MMKPDCGDVVVVEGQRWHDEKNGVYIMVGKVVGIHDKHFTMTIKSSENAAYEIGKNATFAYEIMTINYTKFNDILDNL